MGVSRTGPVAGAAAADGPDDGPADIEQAKAALAASEARCRLLAQIAPVGIVQTDAGGQATFVNDRWCALTGTTAAEALGAGWSDSLHPDDVERITEEWMRAAEHGVELRADCRLTRAAGDDLWVHLAVNALPGPDGEPAGYLAAVTNISDRKRAEVEQERLLADAQEARTRLADQTARLGSLISAAIPGILFADEHGLITQVNASFCDMFDILDDPEELAGTPVAALANRIKEAFADPAEFLRRIIEALKAREPASREQMAAADGRMLEGDYWPVFVDGDYRGDLWLAWDVSERQALEDQLTEQNARLRDLDAVRGQYLATVSHELRTPLSSIISFTELIRGSDRHLSPDTASSLGIIERNARRLLHVVGDLMLLTRIEVGGMPLDLEPVSVPDLLADVAKSGSPEAGRRGVRVEVTAADGPPVRADPIRLYQVFENLLSNAVKFTAEDGRVRLTATRDELFWRVDVEDSGIGIPASELAQIFDRFARATNARIAGLPGTGLGLSVVKAITELHGGRVEVDSAEGTGTTFRVYLPIPEVPR
jgi:PAS domain S-box-containing protein